MIGKLLLTLLVLLGAYALIRARYRADRVARGLDAPRPPLVPLGALRVAAWILLAVMALGSAFYPLQGWLRDREVVEVRVINAGNGQIDSYQARRGAIEGRRFKTLDGREIRPAGVERMIILPVAPDP